MSTEPSPTQRELFSDLHSAARPRSRDPLHRELSRFAEFGEKSLVLDGLVGGRALASYVNEFWTSKQRAANSLHEVSYRACFKPQLPRFFIDRLTEPGDVVYDPFLGRGTTVVEAMLAERRTIGCDINPLSRVLTLPRLLPPTLEQVAERLAEIDFTAVGEAPEDLLTFYHEDTLREIAALRHYLLGEREADLDEVDRWIQMVAVNRLTGHSPGFFSVYTMPPNQAVTLQAQQKINAKREQTPERRDVSALILRKTKSLLADVDTALREQLAANFGDAEILTAPADATPMIADDSVRLVVTSPPFLDVVQYKDDNWLRCWFCGIDPDTVDISMHRKLDEWQAAMTKVFIELARVLQPGGYIAFEVGEVRNGRIRLEDSVMPCGLAAGLDPILLLINDQKFTKTANCWGVSNNQKGTNTNRVVLFKKP